jgi:hypothetical protein
MKKATIWFRYDLNPITVKYTEYSKPFYSFLTTICAIVGGTFTVAGIIDSVYKNIFFFHNRNNLLFLFKIIFYF